MNRKKRKAYKMLRRRLRRATNPFWVSQWNPKQLSLDHLKATMKSVYDSCT